MRKTLCLFLALVLTFSFLQAGAYAATDENELPFSYTVYPEKREYAQGEKIKIYVAMSKTSLDDVVNIRLWADYPITRYYLTPGATEQFITVLRDKEEKDFRIAEDEGVMDIVSKISGSKLLTDVFHRLTYVYKSLTLFYTTIKYGINNFFISIGQKKIDMGSVKVVYDGTEIEFSVQCRYSVRKAVENELIEKDGEGNTASAKIKAVRNSYTGIAFAVSEDKSSYGLFAVNPDKGKAFIFSFKDGIYTIIGSKNISVEPGKAYKMSALFENGRVVCKVYDNPHDTDPYPVFDIYYDSADTGFGIFAREDGYSEFSIDSLETDNAEQTYTNPVYGNAPDPYILNDNGTYYLYATTDSPSGFRVSSSTDLVNWRSLGFCARKGDIFGNDWFWAPEVYRYNNRYWLLYSTDEHLALAVADSPTGPFVKTKDSYILEENCIDGHLLFDDDGSVYLYMAYWGESGEEIWGCRMAADLSGIDRSTLTQLTSCKEDEGRINEGPFMLKYNGRYYLTYSVNGYTDQKYAVRLAVCDSPLGTYVSKGTILEKSGPIVGTGHHSFTESPDGKELFIVYHCHYSATQVHNRKLCIDRCKFVETDDGYTISVYGPTSTPQPFPSN